MSESKIVHYLYHRQQRGVQHNAGAACGWGGYWGNYPENFTEIRALVTCEKCKQSYNWRR